MTDNQKIFNYLHKGDDKACWHERRDDNCKPCKWCKHAPQHRYADNPDYTTNNGFFLLLEGLRAKGFDVETRVFTECTAEIWQWTGSVPNPDLVTASHPDDIRIALQQATLALIEKDGEI